MTRKIQVALLGYGFLGKWHAQKVENLPDAQLSVIVEPDTKKHDELKERYPSTKIYTQIEECIDQFEAALIVTPTSYHFKLCRSLLEHHKHIFCEKPVTQTVSEAYELKQRHQGNTVFQVGHSERCHQVFEMKEIQSWFQEPKTMVEFSRQSPFKGRATDVDVVQDLMIHDLDLMLWLIPERPKSVRAYGQKIRTQKWDQVVAYFYYESGRIVSIKSGRCAATESRSIECTNHKGQLFIDLLNNEFTLATADKLDIQKQSYPKRDHLMIEQQSFYHSISHQSSPMVSLDDGLKAITLIEAVLKSMDLQKEYPLERE